MTSVRVQTLEVNIFASCFLPFASPCLPFSLPRCSFPPLPSPPSISPRQPGMNLPGHVEPCQSEAQLAIHHPALPACHCSAAAFFLVCVCDGCSPAVRASQHHHVHLHRPPRTSSKDWERPCALARSDSSRRTHGWMEGIETGNEGEGEAEAGGRGTQLSQNAAIGGV